MDEIKKTKAILLEEYYNAKLLHMGDPSFSELTDEDKASISNTIAFTKFELAYHVEEMKKAVLAGLTEVNKKIKQYVKII
jgi:hypothetical protein